MNTRDILSRIALIEVQLSLLREDIQKPNDATLVNVAIHKCMLTVVQHYNKQWIVPRFTAADLTTQVKTKQLTAARYDAIFLCHKVFELSRREIAPYFARKECSIRSTLEYMTWCYAKEPLVKQRIDEMSSVLTNNLETTSLSKI